MCDAPGSQIIYQELKYCGGISLVALVVGCHTISGYCLRRRCIFNDIDIYMIQYHVQAIENYQEQLLTQSSGWRHVFLSSITKSIKELKTAKRRAAK